MKARFQAKPNNLKLFPNRVLLTWTTLQVGSHHCVVKVIKHPLQKQLWGTESAHDGCPPESAQKKEGAEKW